MSREYRRWNDGSINEVITPERDYVPLFRDLPPLEERYPTRAAVRDYLEHYGRENTRRVRR